MLSQTANWSLPYAEKLQENVMRTCELVSSLSEKMSSHALLTREQQQNVMKQSRAQVDALVAGKELGALQAAAKLARLGDKVVAQAIQLGESPDAAEAFLRGLGLVRPVVGRGCGAAVNVGVPAPPMNMLLADAPEAARSRAAGPTPPAGANQPTGNAVLFEGVDGSVVAIGRHHVQLAGASTLSAMLSGDYADAPSQGGAWQLPSLTRRQLEIFRDFCETQEGSLSGLDASALNVAASAADFLGCAAMEEAVAAAKRKQAAQAFSSPSFLEQVTKGLAPMTRDLGEQFQVKAELALYEEPAAARLTFECLLVPKAYDSSLQSYANGWSADAKRDITTCLSRIRLSLMRAGYQEINCSQKWNYGRDEETVTFSLVMPKASMFTVDETQIQRSPSPVQPQVQAAVNANFAGGMAA